MENIALIGGVAIIEHNGKHFLIRQSKNKFLQGFWRHPGGHFEIGETYEQVLKREIKEELNVDIELVDKKPRWICENDEEKGKYFGFFLARALDINFDLTNREYDQSNWFTPDEAKKLNLMPATKKFYNIHY